jgi:hypothetical protein
MESALLQSFTMHDLLSRAEMYRRRAGTTGLPDIQDALLRLAQLYEETADLRRQTATVQPYPSLSG